MTQDFKKLEVWVKAKDFCINVYRTTAKFPKEEQFGITSQLRRAAVSVGANIAEGCGRSTNRDFSSFLHNAFGSAKECEYLLILSKELKYVGEEEYFTLIQNLESIGKMLNRLVYTIKTSRKH